MKYSEVDPKVGVHMILRLMGRQVPKASEKSLNVPPKY